MADEATNLIMEQLHILRRGQEGLQSPANALTEEMRDLKGLHVGSGNELGSLAFTICGFPGAIRNAKRSLRSHRTAA